MIEFRCTFRGSPDIESAENLDIVSCGGCENGRVNNQVHEIYAEDKTEHCKSVSGTRTCFPQRNFPKNPWPTFGEIAMEDCIISVDSESILESEGRSPTSSKTRCGTASPNSKELFLPAEQLARISEILSKKGFVQYREEARLMKVDLKFSSILAEDYLEEKIEHEPTVGTLIIQFQESTTKLDVQITNATEKEVELWIKFRKKFTGIAIRKIT